jgi:ABC-type glutathione transport system ATPase component
LWVRSTSLRAVDDFNVEVHEGESIGLVGESGSGKSTVGRCLMGLIDHDDGEILFRGTPISALSASERRRLRAKIQIVQQDPTDTFDPRRILAWSLGEPFRIHKQNNERQVNIAVQELVERIGLDPTLLDSRPPEVTPSNLQRFAIARALATDPELIILDEPTSLLSPYDRESLLHLLGDLQRALSLSYLFISHDLHSVTAVCQRVVIMQSGRIMESGLTGSTFSNPVNDYTQKLVDSFLDENPTVRRVEQHSVRSDKQVN